jgi:carbamoyltransferase
MRFVGIHVGHDASITILDEEGLVEFHAHAERYEDRYKKVQGIDTILRTFPNLTFQEGDFVVSTLLNENSTIAQGYDDSLVRTCHQTPWCQENREIDISLVLDHHLAHAISSWCYRPNDNERLFIAYDGAGPWASTNIPDKCSLVGVINEKGFYKINEATYIPSSVYLADILGDKGMSAGKAMGLAGYFPDVEIMECNAENIMKLLRCSVNWWNNSEATYLSAKNLKNNEGEENDLRFVASFYKFIIEQIWNKVQENILKFGNNRGVVVGGGSALALELNTRIFNMTKDLVFGPAIDDSGLSIGCAAFAYFHINKKWPKPFGTPSLNELQTPLPIVGPQEINEIAQLIADNNVVCLLRGKAEIGPRALGFRSIFASATNYENLKRVSEEVKQREFYRPLAPIVTSEQFDRYFIGPKGEYMQYRVECTEEARYCLPAIVHRDNSARPQVVYRHKDPWLHELLVEYGKISGHECFINTSLNKARKSICNTYEDVSNDMQGKNVTIISVSPILNKNYKIKFKN